MSDATDLDYAKQHAEQAASDVQAICSRLGVVDDQGNVPQMPTAVYPTNKYYMTHRAAKFVNLTLDKIDAKLADEGYPK